MSLKISSLIFLIVVGLFATFTQNMPVTPYFDVIIDRFEDVIPSTEFLDISQVKIRRVNKTPSAIGQITIGSRFGDEITVEIKMYAKQGGEYRLLPYKIGPVPFCKFLIEDTYAYPDIAKASEFPEDIEHNCPLEPRAYKLNGVTIPLEKFPRIAASTGDYAGEVIYSKDDKIVQQFKVYVSIISM